MCCGSNVYYKVSENSKVVDMKSLYLIPIFVVNQSFSESKGTKIIQKNVNGITRLRQKTEI